MDNHTIIKDFQILAFSSPRQNHHLIFLVYFLIYLIGLIGNIIIIACVIIDVHLHTPMYIFILNLSSVDMIFTSSTLPKLMDILLSGNNRISFIQCFAQLFFYLFTSGTEDILLSCMAYDRYLAICKPLHYHLIMTTKKCVFLLLCTWVTAAVNSLFFTLSIYQIDVCHSNRIEHFFCEIKAFSRIVCANHRYHIILYFEIIVLGFFPFILSLTSYTKIILIVLSIKSLNGRRKAFSTCTSHITVLLTFYGAGICMYVKPPSGHLEQQDLVFSTLYTAVTPMLNPLIYSLRNKDVKGAILRIISMKRYKNV